MSILQSLCLEFSHKNDSFLPFSRIEKTLQKRMGLTRAAFLYRQENEFKSLESQDSKILREKTPVFDYLTRIQKPWTDSKKSRSNAWRGFWPVTVNGQCVACYALERKSPLTKDEKKVMELLVDRTASYLVEKQLWKELESANRQATLGWMSAAVVHEIRNPLSALNTFIQLLPEKQKDPHFMETFQKITQKEIARLIRLTEDLQNFLKLTPEKLEKVDLQQVIHRMADLTRPLFNAKKVALKIKASSGLFLQGAEGQVECLIINLLQNALKAVESGGIVEIASYFLPRSPYGPNRIKLQFKDNGKGISNENLNLIFTPFFSANQAGTGLGLTICQKVVENHQGHIEVKSILKKGTVFTIFLPGSIRARVH